VAPDEKLNVYSGDVTVTVLLSAAKPIVPGSYKLPGTLRYQACDDRSCFPPKSLALEIPVVIQSGK
jgi:thiol:disulfide interchange protein DsbD